MEKKTIKSTIVIPNYNGINYIEACLDSLQHLSGCDVEIIVVDNASTDGSLELVQKKFPKIQLIRNPQNEGFSKAVNQGIMASKTPFVILLNNDTEVAPDAVMQLEQMMERDASLFSASAKMISLHDKTKIDSAGDYYCALGWAYAKGKGKAPQRYTKDYDIFSSCAGAAIYRRKYFDEVGMFDEQHFAYLEDVDIGYRARLYGYRNYFASKAIVYHAGSATSGSRYNAFKTRLASRNSIYLIYKNMPLGQILFNAPFLAAGYAVKTLFFCRKGMGKAYVNGLLEGVRLCRTQDSKTHKVRFQVKRTGCYLRIQLALWRNLAGLVKG